MKKLQPPALPAATEAEIQTSGGASRYVVTLVRALRAALDDVYRVLSRHEPQTGSILLTAEDKSPGAGYEAAGMAGTFYAWKAK